MPVFSKPVCDSCLKRSNPEKCDGRQPCAWCFNKTRTCLFNGIPPPERKGRSSASPQPCPDRKPIPLADRLSSPPVDPYFEQPVAPSAALGFSSSLDGDSYIASLAASSSDFGDEYADSGDLFLSSDEENSAPGAATHGPAVRLRGGAMEDDEDIEDNNSQVGNGHDGPDVGLDNAQPPAPAVTTEQLIRTILNQQAQTAQIIQLLLDDKKRKDREDDTHKARASIKVKTSHTAETAGTEQMRAVERWTPPQVRQVFENGWKKHVPFTLLTNSYCESKEAKKEIGDKISVSADGSFLTTPMVLSVPNKHEENLSLAEWMQAIARFMDLIREFRPDEAESWQKHVDNILLHDRRDDVWGTLMKYCAEIRDRATRASINPAIFHQKAGKPPFFKRCRTHGTTNRPASPRLANIPFGVSKAHPPDPSLLHLPPTPPHQSIDPPRNHVSAFGVQAPTTSTNTAKQPPNPLENQLFSKEFTQHGSSEEQSSAGASIPLDLHAPSDSVKTAHTPALYADLQLMGHSHAIRELNRVHTELVPDQWESTLRQLDLLDKFRDVPLGLRLGFRIGALGPVSSTFIPKNHKSATLHPDIIQEHILSELAAGRYAGPYTQDVLEGAIGPFRCAPLGVVDKASSPGKFRVIQDFSFPHDNSKSSLNDQIDTNFFDCEWGLFNDVAQAVASAAPGSIAATCDVDAAYRRMPVHPADRPHTVVHWQGRFFIDSRVPFGASSSNGIFGRCGDAAKHIYSTLGFGQIFKWVDDYIFLQSPPSHDYAPTAPSVFGSIQAIYDVAERLGWPWKRSKTRPFATTFTYLGFDWNLPGRSVTIPLSKREKYSRRIADWLPGKRFTLKQTQEVVGCLAHCAQAVPNGRPRLRALIAFVASFPHSQSTRFLRRPVPEPAIDEIAWWREQLARPDCGSVVRPNRAPISTLIMSDASTSFGLGVIIDNLWWSWRLMQGWRTPGRDIGWAEAIALELAVNGAIQSGIRDCTIRCLCDNRGVVLAWAAGRSRNVHQNTVILRILSAAWVANINIIVEYIRSADNLADGPSRGVPPDSTMSRSSSIIPVAHDITHLVIPALLL
ncbi:polyprotein like [Ceratobasidium sp. AG-Ba]|nr:polyprotein like [Ceratobasidium sp. AG-Ba]QRV83195.1 polyprotein like [Ceratobasidium sp. AG-Ba]